jgi:hypothetical protein
MGFGYEEEELSFLCYDYQVPPMRSNILGIVLITLNERPMNVESGFFVGRVCLKKQTLVGKKKVNGVIETFRTTSSLRGR